MFFTQKIIKGNREMKKIITILLSIILCFISTFSLSSCGEDDAIYVNTNAFFAPFEYYDGTEIKGVDIDIMNLVGEKLGKKVVVKNTDFELIIDNVASGKQFDCGAAGLTILPEREALVDFSIPYFTSKQYVIFKSGRISKAGTSADGEDYVLWETLAGLTIGVQTDTTGDIQVGDQIGSGALKDTGAEKKQYASANLASDALGLYVDAVVVDQLPAEFIASKNEGLECLAVYIDQNTATIEQYAICVNKNLPDLLKAINEVLTELGEEGVNALVKKHLGL